MTAPAENSNLEMKLSDLQKKFGEEKMAHGQTILQLLSTQDQVQTAEAEVAKAKELVAEITKKLDQAREEIRRLRAQAQGGQAKNEDLEDQMAQLKLSEQTYAQSAIEAQAQELETAQAKIASLEAVVAKARAVLAEHEVTSSSDNTAQEQSEELKAAQAKIASLEVQMAQLKVVEQFQAQELNAALAKITELEAQMAQSKIQAQEENLLLNYENRDLRAKTRNLHENHANYEKAQNQKLEAAQAQVKDLESQVAQAQEEVRDAQNKLLFVESFRSKPKAPVRIPTNTNRSSPPTWLENSGYLDIDNLTECSAQWFGPEHLYYFSGTRLELSKTALSADHLACFLDSWLAGSHPYLETIILNDFEPQPVFFDKFASCLVRDYGDNYWNHTMTFHLERPSDGRVACVKITAIRFIFIV